MCLRCSNKDILAINADSLGRMGRRFSIDIGAAPLETGHAEGWRKDLANGDVAVVLCEYNTSSCPLTD
jgi:hypothetical protein